ncbi:hypothetical protein ACFV97_14835, partial [Streptomyces sp. NPDC059913]
NPASAFVRAVKGIIDIVTFIVNQGAQIVDFVNAVLDAVIAIANGGTASVPKMVETALATSIPLLIGLLASLLGINGLANKVKSVFHTVAKPVNRAIDKIINLITKKGKALQGKRKNDKSNPGKIKQNKKDLLEKAITSLHPKITNLLERGATGLALRARLALWKTQFRLTSLTTEKTGDSVEIWAKVNPRGQVARGEGPSHEELRRIVNRVVGQILNNTEIRRRYRQMQRSLSKDNGLEITASESYPAGARALIREGGRIPQWSKRKHILGSPPQMVEVTELNTPGRTNAKVVAPGHEKYTEISTELKKTGLGDRRIAAEIRLIIRTGKCSTGISTAHRELLGTLTYLMFLRETHRNPRNLAQATMTLDLIERGSWTWHHALAAYEGKREGDRGAFPMSMQGAPLAARGLTEEDAGKPKIETGSKSEETRERRRRELEKREFDLMEEWAMRHIGAKRGLIGMSANSIGDHIRRLLLDTFLGQ